MAMTAVQRVIETTEYERDEGGYITKETKTTVVEAELPTPEEEIFG